MKKIFFGILMGFVGVFVIYFAVMFAREQTKSETKITTGTSAPATSEPNSAQQTFGLQSTTNKNQFGDSILIEKKDGKGNWTDLYLYDNGKLKPLSPPDSAIRSVSPVSDGSDVYYMVNSEGRKKIISVSIASGKEETITDSTPLVSPRELFASNDGKVVAFYLDGSNKLTELWTYDVKKGRKRVSLERLSQISQGPFWDANGGFLIRDKEQLIRGTPERTGGDILPVSFNWKNIPSGMSIIPSPGGTQVVYVSCKNGSPGCALKVWDLKENKEREIIELPSSKVEVLGWDTSSLLVSSGEKELKLWKISKNQKTNYTLDAGSSSLTLSGDGSRYAYVYSSKNGEQLVIRETSDNRIFGNVSLPSEPIPFNARAEDDSAPATYRIVQYLRPLVETETFVKPAENELAEEAIVGYVMQHIRQIAEAPQGEPVTAEKVLFTRTPGAVYVDYLVGTTIWRRLVQVDGDVSGNAVQYKLIGVFAPINGEWTLARGMDLGDKTATSVYEFDAEAGKWFKQGMTNVQP